MSDFSAIASALYSKLGGTAGTVYYALAPVQAGSASVPYVIFERSSGSDEYWFAGAHHVRTEYVVKAVSNRQWPSEAQDMYEDAHAKIQQQGLSVTGYNALRCERTATLEYRDPDGYWHVGGVYRIEVGDS